LPGAIWPGAFCMFFLEAEMTSVEALTNALYMAIKAPTSDASSKLVAYAKVLSLSMEDADIINAKKIVKAKIKIENAFKLKLKRMK
jgi:gentisate 1,2-dioxygenase